MDASQKCVFTFNDFYVFCLNKPRFLLLFLILVKTVYFLVWHILYNWNQYGSWQKKKKVGILDLSASLFQIHMMLQSNCRYVYCCNLFNKTFLLHWSKECVYFLEHVEASFPSSTWNGIPPPSCSPPASHAPWSMPWRQAEIVPEKEGIWLGNLWNFSWCKK